jgi:hypothetical protein
LGEKGVAIARKALPSTSGGMPSQGDADRHVVCPIPLFAG